MVPLVREEELNNITTLPEFEVPASGGDLEQGEDDPPTDGERTIQSPVEVLVEPAAQARVVRVRVLLHQGVSHGSVLVEDQLLHQLVDGEHPQSGGAASFLHQEVGDELGGLEVPLSNKQDGSLRLGPDLQEVEHLAQNYLHVGLQMREIRGEAVASPGILENLELESHGQTVQRRDELEIARSSLTSPVYPCTNGSHHKIQGNSIQSPRL